MEDSSHGYDLKVNDRPFAAMYKNHQSKQTVAWANKDKKHSPHEAKDMTK